MITWDLFTNGALFIKQDAYELAIDSNTIGFIQAEDNTEFYLLEFGNSFRHWRFESYNGTASWEQDRTELRRIKAEIEAMIRDKEEKK